MIMFIQMSTETSREPRIHTLVNTKGSLSLIQFIVFSHQKYVCVS